VSRYMGIAFLMLGTLLVLATGTTPVAAQAAKAIDLEVRDGEANVNGSIDKDDPADPVRKHPAKVYAVKLDPDRTYRIDLMSKAFDSYLRLNAPAGNEVARDDDSGGMLNARIVYNCTQTGQYRIIATSLGGGGRGNFTLRVTER